MSLMILTASLFVVLPGCGADGPPAVTRFPVTGTVTLDGQPIDSGNIRFLDTTVSGGDAGDIKGGSYSLQATPGKKRVEIIATRASSKPVEGKPDVMDTESLIPPQYNTKSELTAEVVADKPNEFKFELKSKP
ncbi:MAG: hypothetical protein ACKVT0_15425 [Planctomycetaceae bacterium]